MLLCSLEARAYFAMSQPYSSLISLSTVVTIYFLNMRTLMGNIDTNSPVYSIIQGKMAEMDKTFFQVTWTK